jgi:hypothetical protein
MTAGAWIMMLATWAVIIFFTARFFVMVLWSSGQSPPG